MEYTQNEEKKEDYFSTKGGQDNTKPESPNSGRKQDKGISDNHRKSVQQIVYNLKLKRASDFNIPSRFNVNTSTNNDKGTKEKAIKNRNILDSASPEACVQEDNEKNSQNEFYLNKSEKKKKSQKDFYCLSGYDFSEGESFQLKEQSEGKKEKKERKKRGEKKKKKKERQKERQKKKREGWKSGSDESVSTARGEQEIEEKKKRKKQGKKEKNKERDREDCKVTDVMKDHTREKNQMVTCKERMSKQANSKDEMDHPSDHSRGSKDEDIERKKSNTSIRGILTTQLDSDNSNSSTSLKYNKNETSKKKGYIKPQDGLKINYISDSNKRYISIWGSKKKKGDIIKLPKINLVAHSMSNCREENKTDENDTTDKS
ncbi:conserved Plasmodium protein, unknown function [Plasmodium ovale wallikeri]|uniref:Uncharacterized protein n=1 Tax=Plasmodium ovale wallikeri TaxID=864142 RepID=A0A1A8ZCB9_PLAOA|nr:conserved Plasmodium protein, unknown function [Plasmodium ovale wallikeri]SBT41949.1 conserved Plasmodium protein, unknown function [Plasmodium ovale wallikeri]